MAATAAREPNVPLHNAPAACREHSPNTGTYCIDYVTSQLIALTTSELSTQIVGERVQRGAGGEGFGSGLTVRMVT